MFIDTETFSEVPITHGTYKYAENAEIMTIQWARDRHSPVHVWDRTEDPVMPAELHELLSDPSELITAWNAMFDRNVLRLGDMKLEIPISRWRCMMVRALAHALPGSLDKVGTIMGLTSDEAKLKDGKSLIRLFCKPLGKNRKLRRATRETHPEEWARFLEYGAFDIKAMQALDSKIPTWNMARDYALVQDLLDYEDLSPAEKELWLWHYDQRCNDRGFRIDLDLVRAALAATDKEQARLRREAKDLTDGAVKATTQRDALLDHILTDFGLDLPDLKRSTVQRMIEDPDTDPLLKCILENRFAATTSSTAKYKALERSVCADGRIRGTVQFDGGARTRRAAGRLFQPQNLPSRDVLHGQDVDDAIEALLGGYCDLLFDVMRACSSTIRGCLVPTDGLIYNVSDLSNIEGRGAAWLAREDWKLDAFRAFDNGTGPDLYKLAYARAFKVPVESVTKFQRQIGKVLELFMQYEGGVGAFLTGALAYGIDLDDLASKVMPELPEDVLEECENFLEWQTKQGRGTYGLKAETFMACDGLKRLWRRQHPAIVRTWRDLKEGAIEAVCQPDTVIVKGRFKFKKSGTWLRLLLPSGRSLCYPGIRVEDGAVSYMGINQYNRKWSRIKTYGGKFFENACQSFSRDVLYDAKPEVEKARYLQVLEVHDELVAESLRGSAEGLSEILATPPPYALDMPLAAGGFDGLRYGKD